VDVADGLGGLPGVLQGAVEVVEVLRRELVDLAGLRVVAEGDPQLPDP
jgi:hypothetical protein